MAEGYPHTENIYSAIKLNETKYLLFVVAQCQNNRYTKMFNRNDQYHVKSESSVYTTKDRN